MSDSSFDDSSGVISNVTPDKPYAGDSTHDIITNEQVSTITLSDSIAHLTEHFENLHLVCHQLASYTDAKSKRMNI